MINKQHVKFEIVDRRAVRVYTDWLLSCGKIRFREATKRKHAERDKEMWNSLFKLLRYHGIMYDTDKTYSVSTRMRDRVVIVEVKDDDCESFSIAKRH